MLELQLAISESGCRPRAEHHGTKEMPSRFGREVSNTSKSDNVLTVEEAEALAANARKIGWPPDPSNLLLLISTTVLPDATVLQENKTTVPKHLMKD